MKKYRYIYIFLIILLTPVIYGHVDNYLIPEECGSCHIGHGLKDEPMLAHSEEELCYQCHSDDSRRSLMMSSGKLSSEAVLDDIEKEFEKVYRHPVQRGVGHKPNEKLDGYTSTSINHSECVDCHNPHSKIVMGSKIKYDVSGITLSGQYTETSTQEYEICFKCHASTQGLNSYSKNMRKSFTLSNKSQHPVTTSLSLSKSASLNMSLNFGSSMKCSDCHTNDDENGPKGPHGSRYKYLLSGNYNTDVYGIESGFAYEFCYSCHNRESILNNESFPKHREHIVGDQFKNIQGTSCYTCHASHSSESNLYLIEFNPEAVSPDNKTKQVKYYSNGVNSGECYLTCHGYSHSPGRYIK